MTPGIDQSHVVVLDGLVVVEGAVVEVVGPVVVGVVDVTVVGCDEVLVSVEDDVVDDVDVLDVVLEWDDELDELLVDVAVGCAPETRVGCPEEVLLAVAVTELEAEAVAEAAARGATAGRTSAVDAAAGGTAVDAAGFTRGLAIPAGIAVAASPLRREDSPAVLMESGAEADAVEAPAAELSELAPLAPSWLDADAEPELLCAGDETAADPEPSEDPLT